MRINFKKVVLHNFLSYGHSEIDLTNRSYCMVSGINRCPKDNAVSNGSGKSSWISAICWALTGETIQGITKDIKNIYIDEDSCYVELYFDVDDKQYKIIRYNKPKSDLKIFINNEDKSGKGIRESELALASYLPDITKDLISSVILLGQGLPNKLSSHSPSGRKEMLEKLSKSDFMIEDIKKRLSERTVELNKRNREYEDTLLKNNTLLTSSSAQLDSITKEINNAVCPDYNTLIANLEKTIADTEKEIEELGKMIENHESNISAINNKLLQVSNEKQEQLSGELNAYNTKRDSLVEEKLKFKSKIDALNAEINKIKSIKDVCPTCGRPFENVVKPSTESQEKEVAELTEQLNKVLTAINEAEQKHRGYVQSINEDFDKDINTYRSQLNEEKNLSDECKMKKNSKSNSLLTCSNEKTKYISDRDNYDKYFEGIKSKQAQLQKDVEELTKTISETTKLNEDLQKHIDVLKKMDTLVKRDFRGYLLSNVIEFINIKSKEYCSEVFGSDELEFKLDGNNIDISYCGKSFESLSGGEKQKVDLVLQFAIRDMMSKYLDFSSNILVLDEIFDNLDARGTNNVLTLVANKLCDIESLFIISHHADELSIPYDTELTIVKSENGISEVL